MIACEIVRKGW